MIHILQRKKLRFRESRDMFMFTKLVSGKIGSCRFKFHGFNESSKNYFLKSRVLNGS